MVAIAINSACGSAGVITPAHPAADVLHKEGASGKTPAVQYRFFNQDSVLFAYDEGMADVARRVPISSATTFNGFSVTKTFTALAILQLAEQGKLEIDGRAADYLPGFPYSRAISVHDLLTHSAGIPNPIPLRWIHLQEEHGSFDRDAFFRGIFAQQPRLRSKPNERFAYSNLGYVLLGELIEHVSGMRYEQYITENILTPIGLLQHDLGFAIEDAAHARGYHRRMSMSYVALGFLMDRKKHVEPGAGPWRAFRPYYLNGASYGGLIGTADAFMRYIQALLDPQSRLISEESRRLLFTENVLRSGKPSE
jgi:D-alanyl-D-alanine carboxypeptidase